MQPCSVESVRVGAIIEEALEKLSFLASITPDIVAHRDELSQTVGDEITRILAQQRTLESRYEELVGQRLALKAMSNKRYKENQDEVRTVARALRESTNELCRNLKGNPNIAENLSKVQVERSGLHALLARTLRELHDGSFASLTSAVEEEAARTSDIAEIMEREKEAAFAVGQLKADLAAERRGHDEDVEKRDEEIARLKEQLSEAKASTSVEVRYLAQTVRASCQTLRRLSSAETANLEEEIATLRKELEIEERAHRESGDFLRRKQSALQQDVEAWMGRYETELEELDRELEGLKASWRQSRS